MATQASGKGSLAERLRFLGIAGVGLFGDGYLNITIGLVVPIIGYLYYADDKNAVPTVQQDVIKGALSLGMIVGQIGFGLFGDALGRQDADNRHRAHLAY